jgi:F420-dependent methylenetetrahydromethanopterin dehydrogenase
MTTLSFDEDGVDVVYEGTEFRLEKDMVENATQQSYMSVTDHQVLKMVEPNPALSGEPREIRDILR